MARTTLRRIGDLGIDVALDDFGTGYSSLEHLRHMPLAEIKIDQIFVASMTHDADDAAIVASTINMAHALGLRPWPKGRRQPTRQLLTELGCDLGQGWHLSTAVPSERIPTLIAAARPDSTNQL